MSLRDLLVELVVLIREAEDFQGVVLVVREVQLHRHVCHLRRLSDDIFGGASLILGKCMNVLIHIQNVLVILFKELLELLVTSWGLLKLWNVSFREPRLMPVVWKMH